MAKKIIVSILLIIIGFVIGFETAWIWRHNTDQSLIQTLTLVMTMQRVELMTSSLELLSEQDIDRLKNLLWEYIESTIVEVERHLSSGVTFPDTGDFLINKLKRIRELAEIQGRSALSEKIAKLEKELKARKHNI